MRTIFIVLAALALASCGTSTWTSCSGQIINNECCTQGANGAWFCIGGPPPSGKRS